MIEAGDGMEPTALCELGSQVGEVMRKGQEATYSVCSFYNVYFQELIDEPGLTHGKSFLDAVHFVLTHPA